MSAVTTSAKGRAARETASAASTSKLTSRSSLQSLWKTRKEPGFKEKVLRWALSFTVVGYVTSLLLHAVVLAVLSLIVVKSMEKEGSLSTTVFEADDETAEFVDVIDTRMEESGLPSEPVEIPQFHVQEMSTELTEPVLSNDLLSRLAVTPSEGVGGSGGDRDGGIVPRGTNAVTQGSFTAWTIPEDPEPRKPYFIVIEVELPENVRRYRVSDLSGRVIGSDNYRQAIPWDNKAPRASRVQRRGRIVVVNLKDYLPIKDRRAQLLIEIPGAEFAVEDRIEVQSQLLRESQVLKIQF